MLVISVPQTNGSPNRRQLLSTHRTQAPCGQRAVLITRILMGPGFGICVCNLTSHLTEFLNTCDNVRMSRKAVSNALPSFYRKHSQLLRTDARGFHEMQSQQEMGVVYSVSPRPTQATCEISQLEGV